MWNKTWQPLIDAGKLQVLGIVQEQHAERTKLYKQWKQYQWPIAQDALNLLNVKVVPLLVAIDEQGAVVSHRASPQFVKQWLDGEIKQPATGEQVAKPDQALTVAREQFLSSEMDGLQQAIGTYEKLIGEGYAENKKAHFEVAVAYRKRFEAEGNADDFQMAIDHWSTALKIDPNQYIYRRRIEQYGARLGKPYPFYDWVETAVKEIKERGETPSELTVPITGAEIASAVRRFEASKDDSIDLGTAERVDAIDASLVKVSAVAVPKAVQPGKATRVHVLLTPQNVKWNNLGDPAVLMLYEVDGAKLAKRQLAFEMPEEEESTETRRFEFEVQLNKDIANSGKDSVTVKGIALFGVCLDESGICTYKSSPFEITVNVAK